MEGIQLKAIEDIHVGDTAYFAKTVTEVDINMFAMLSGDFAPQHVNAEFGKTMMYKSRIAHGMLTAGLICPTLTKLCGDGSVIYSQEIKFKSAVLLGDTVVVRAQVTEILAQEDKVKIDIVCSRQGALPEERPFIIGTIVQKLEILP